MMVVIIVALGFTSVFFTFVPSVPPAHAETVGAWGSTTNYPTVISGQSCVTSGGYIYCVGGSSSGFKTTAYYASISSSGVGNWISTTTYPGSPYIWSCVASGGYIYCISTTMPQGLTGPTNPQPPLANDVYFAPLSSSGIGAWTKTTGYPSGITDASCTASGGYVYCVGGDSGATFTQVLVTDATYYAVSHRSGVSSWTLATSYPLNMIHESCAASSGDIYCVGGFSTTGPHDYNWTYYAVLPQRLGPSELGSRPRAIRLHMVMASNKNRA